MTELDPLLLLAAWLVPALLLAGAVGATVALLRYWSKRRVQPTQLQSLASGVLVALLVVAALSSGRAFREESHLLQRARELAASGHPFAARTALQFAAESSPFSPGSVAALVQLGRSAGTLGLPATNIFDPPLGWILRGDGSRLAFAAGSPEANSYPDLLLICGFLLLCGLEYAARGRLSSPWPVAAGLACLLVELLTLPLAQVPGDRALLLFSTGPRLLVWLLLVAAALVRTFVALAEGPVHSSPVARTIRSPASAPPGLPDTVSRPSSGGIRIIAISVAGTAIVASAVTWLLLRTPPPAVCAYSSNPEVLPKALHLLYQGDGFPAHRATAEAALAIILDATQHDDKCADAWSGAAAAYYWRAYRPCSGGDYAQALQAVQRGLQLQPTPQTKYELLSTRAKILAAQLRWDESTAAFREALQVWQPPKSDVWLDDMEVRASTSPKLVSLLVRILDGTAIHDTDGAGLNSKELRWALDAIQARHGRQMNKAPLDWFFYCDGSPLPHHPALDPQFHDNGQSFDKIDRANTKVFGRLLKGAVVAGAE